MKITITFTLYLFTILAFSQGDEYSYTNYHSNGNIKTYLNHKHGVYIEFFNNSQRKVAGECEGGIVANLDKKLGEWVYFNKQGDLLKVYNFDCKELNSKLIFDDSCRVMSGVWTEFYSDKNTVRNKGTLRNYKKEGKWEKYYDTGIPREIIYYKNDKRHGENSYYYDNGSVFYITNYQNGKEIGAYKCYDKQTQKLTIKTTMLNGKFNDAFQENYANGKVYRKGKFDKGDKIGYWEFYFDNGALKMAGFYKTNKRTGLWMRYNNKGVLLAEIQFKAGNRNGKCIFYNEDGSIKETKFYKQGKLVEQE